MDELDYIYLSKLVALTKEGDSDAFAELYAATYKKQYLFAFKYLRDEYLAQDALQETYILALKNIGRLKEDRLFVSWINQINFRVCFDMADKNRRSANELAVAAYEAEQVFVPEADPGNSVADEDERRYIMKKIMDLPATESKVVIMKYYNGMKLEDIAKAMGCNRSTVKRHLASGRKRLQGLLAEI